MHFNARNAAATRGANYRRKDNEVRQRQLLYTRFALVAHTKSEKAPLSLPPEGLRFFSPSDKFLVFVPEIATARTRGDYGRTKGVKATRRIFTHGAALALLEMCERVKRKK